MNRDDKEAISFNLESQMILWPQVVGKPNPTKELISSTFLLVSASLKNDIS